MIETNKRIKNRQELVEWINYETSKYGLPKTNFIRELLSNNEINLLKKHIKLLRKTEYYLNTNHKVLEEHQE